MLQFNKPKFFKFSVKLTLRQFTSVAVYLNEIYLIIENLYKQAIPTPHFRDDSWRNYFELIHFLVL